MGSPIEILEDIDLESLYTKLLAYAEFKLRNLKWNNGTKTATKGMTARDFVQKAFKEFASGEKCWDDSKGYSLEKYLRGLISNYISNAITSKENKLASVVDFQQEKDLRRVKNGTVFSPHEELIAKQLESKIQAAVIEADDSTEHLQSIYILMLESNYKPNMAKDELGIDIKTVYSYTRKIRRIAERVIQNNIDA